jgi:hypothetical protein
VVGGVHVVPSVVSSAAEGPTAIQVVATEHDTDARLATVGAGLTAVHTVPFEVPIIPGLLSRVPTDTQFVVVEHDTLTSSSVPNGAAPAAQVVPLVVLMMLLFPTA